MTKTGIGSLYVVTFSQNTKEYAFKHFLVAIVFIYFSVVIVFTYFSVATGTNVSAAECRIMVSPNLSS